MTNSTKLVAPLWGAERMLGTNPIAIAFPGKDEPAIVIDIATSAVAYGKVENAMRHQQPIPHGWAIDRHGRPTTDPRRMIEDGALLPFGSDRERGGHKGYALAMMVDVLSAVLSGPTGVPSRRPSSCVTRFPSAASGKGSAISSAPCASTGSSISTSSSDRSTT
jgi:LDH2 family malate/lactate/ureidoglycolate dehydrogenase